MYKTIARYIISNFFDICACCDCVLLARCKNRLQIELNKNVFNYGLVSTWVRSKHVLENRDKISASTFL